MPLDGACILRVDCTSEDADNRAQLMLAGFTGFFDVSGFPRCTQGAREGLDPLPLPAPPMRDMDMEPPAQGHLASCLTAMSPRCALREFWILFCFLFALCRGAVASRSRIARVLLLLLATSDGDGGW